MKIRVLLLEDEDDWITLIKGHVAKEDKISLVGVAKNGAELVQALQKQTVDVVLLDMWLKGKMEGLGLAREVRKLSNAKIIVLTSESEIQEGLYFENISGFLNKTQIDMLCNTICCVAIGEYPYEKLFRDNKKNLIIAELASLSERERSVMRPWIKGKTMVQIGIAEGVSENTIKHQISSIYKKLGIKERHKRREQLKERYQDMLEYL